MNPQLKNHLLWAFIAAQGICAVTAIAFWLTGFPWRRFLGDALFLEGAVLMVTGGMLDIGGSVTFGHIRSLGKSRFGDAPPEVKAPGRNYVVLLAGLMLCVQGGLLAYFGD
jgi:hypothetical protein